MFEVQLKANVNSLSQIQKTFYKIQISFRNFSHFPHVPFAFVRFFGEDVTLESFLMRDLSGAGNLEAFFCA